MNIPRKRIIIIADDLTGAMDATGYLASRGLGVVVHMGRRFVLAEGVNVINTDSRRDPASVASQKLKDVVKGLEGEAIFKKIDSTLRGNIAVEIKAILDTLHLEKAIVTPAFPATGRTVENGLLLVKGVPVAETEFGRDPVNPVRTSHIPSLFEADSKIGVGLITIEDIEKGPEHLSKSFVMRPEKVLVCDVTEQVHLQTIIGAAIPLRDRLLLSGSGGLAREIGVLLGETNDRGAMPVQNRSIGPALLIVGSHHSVSAAQLLKAKSDLDMTIIKLETGDLRAGRSREISRLVNDAVHLLELSGSVAITSAFSQYHPGLAGDVISALGEITREILTNKRPAGLFLSGGETAMAVCERLCIPSIRVYGEIAPGIPAGEITFEGDRLRLVTKAGGFGGETAIIESMHYLERGIL